MLAYKLMKRNPVSLVIRDRCVKITVRYHSTPTRRAIIKMTNNTKSYELEHLDRSLYLQNWRLAMQTGMNQMLLWRSQFMGDTCFYHEGNEVSRGQNLPRHNVGWPLVPVRKGKSWLCPLLCLPIWLSICLKFYSF